MCDHQSMSNSLRSLRELLSILWVSTTLWGPDHFGESGFSPKNATPLNQPMESLHWFASRSECARLFANWNLILSNCRLLFVFIEINFSFCQTNLSFTRAGGFLEEHLTVWERTCRGNFSERWVWRLLDRDSYWFRIIDAKVYRVNYEPRKASDPLF